MGSTVLTADVISQPAVGMLEWWSVYSLDSFPTAGGGVGEFVVSVTTNPPPPVTFTDTGPEWVTVKDTGTPGMMQVARGAWGTLMASHSAGDVISTVDNPNSSYTSQTGGRSAVFKGPFRVTYDMSGLAAGIPLGWTPEVGDVLLGISWFVIAAFNGSPTVAGIGSPAMVAASADIPITVGFVDFTGVDFDEGTSNTLLPCRFPASTPILVQINGANTTGIVDIYLSVLPGN